MVITSDLISRYPFFADLTHDQVATLASVAEGLTADTGEFIFREGDDLCCFYIVVEGAVGILIEAPKKEDKGQMEDVIFSGAAMEKLDGYNANKPISAGIRLNPS